MKKNLIHRLGLFLSILTFLLIISCATKPNEKDAAWNYVQKNPTEFAQWCKERFPIVSTQFIPGETKIVRDSIFVPGELIECPPTLTNPKPQIKIPDKYVNFDKEVKTPDTIKSVDTRDLQIAQNAQRKAEGDREYWKNQTTDCQDRYIVLQNENKSLLDENTTLSKSKSTAWWITGILIGFIIIFIVFKILKR